MDTFDAFDNEQLVNQLLRIQTDNELMSAISKRSYLHVNQFYKINLGVLLDGTTIRIHVWLLSPYLRQNPHSHAWNFESKIVWGSIDNCVYNATPDPGGIYVKNTQNLSQHRGMSIFNTNQMDSAKYSLKLVNADVFMSGDTYTLDADIIHTSYPRIDCTITVIKQGPFIKPECDVYSTLPFIQNDRRPPLTIALLHDLLTYIVTTIRPELTPICK